METVLPGVYQKQNGRPPVAPYEEEDFGPETDVDSADDVLLSPSIAAAKALASQSTGPGSGEVWVPAQKLQQQQESWLKTLPWSYADAVRSPPKKKILPESPDKPPVEETNNDVVEADAESGDDSEEEEWNYVRGEEKEQSASKNTEEELSESDMESRLNPNAAEFVPGVHLDPVVASSSSVGTEQTMDNITVPSEKEFDSEISQRPSELEPISDEKPQSVKSEVEPQNGNEESAISFTKDPTFGFFTSINTSVCLPEDEVGNTSREETNPFLQNTYESKPNEFEGNFIKDHFSETDPFKPFDVSAELHHPEPPVEVCLSPNNESQAPQDVDSVYEFINGDKSDVSPLDEQTNNLDFQATNQEPTSSSGFDSESNEEGDLCSQDKHMGITFGDGELEKLLAANQESTKVEPDNEIESKITEACFTIEPAAKDIVSQEALDFFTRDTLMKETTEGPEKVVLDTFTSEIEPSGVIPSFEFKQPEEDLDFKATDELKMEFEPHFEIESKIDDSYKVIVPEVSTLNESPITLVETVQINSTERSTTPTELKDNVPELKAVLSPFVNVRSEEQSIPFENLVTPEESPIKEELPADHEEKSPPEERIVQDLVLECLGENGGEVHISPTTEQVRSPLREFQTSETNQTVDFIQQLQFNESIKKVEHYYNNEECNSESEIEAGFEIIRNDPSVLEVGPEPSTKESLAVDEKLLMDKNELEPATPLQEEAQLTSPVVDITETVETKLEGLEGLSHDSIREVDIKKDISVAFEETLASPAVESVEELKNEMKSTPEIEDVKTEEKTLVLESFEPLTNDTAQSLEVEPAAATPPSTPAPGVTEENNEAIMATFIAAAGAAAAVGTVAATTAAAELSKPVDVTKKPAGAVAPPKKASPSKPSTPKPGVKSPTKPGATAGVTKKPSASTLTKPTTTTKSAASPTTKPSTPTSQKAPLKGVPPAKPTSKPNTPVGKTMSSPAAKVSPKPSTPTSTTAKPKPESTASKPAPKPTTTTLAATKTKPLTSAAPKPAASKPSVDKAPVKGDPAPIKRPSSATSKTTATATKAPSTTAAKPPSKPVAASTAARPSSAKLATSKPPGATLPKPGAPKPAPPTSKPSAPAKAPVAAKGTLAAKPKVASATASKPKPTAPVSTAKKGVTSDKSVKDATNNKLSAKQPKKVDSKGDATIKKELIEEKNSEPVTQEHVVTTTNGHIDIMQNGIQNGGDSPVNNPHPEIIEALN